MSNGGRADNVGKAAPYIAPCGGWVAAKGSLFGCHNQYSKQVDGKFSPHPKGWPRYQNTTRVPCIKCDGYFSESQTTEPYVIFPCANTADEAECLAGLICGDGDPVECASCDGDHCENAQSYTRGNLSCQIANTYALYDPPEYYNPAICHNKGFKNVVAAKSWHGVYGYGTYINVGSEETPDCQPPVGGTKYLTIFVVQESYVPGAAEPECCTTLTTHVEMSASVGKYTGLATSTWSGTVTAGFAGTDTARCCDDCSSVVNDIASCEAAKDEITLFDFRCGKWVGGVGDITAALNGDMSDWTIDSSSVTETEISIVAHRGPGEEDGCDPPRFSITQTLSGSYSAADVASDVAGLLALWDLCDDSRYPWRIDSPGLAPFVTYDEGGARSPLDCFCMNDDDSFCSARGTIHGAPNPIGYDHYWDSSRSNPVLRDNGSGAICWFQNSYGAYSPLPHATQWTEDFAPVPHGAWAQYNCPIFVVPNGGPGAGGPCGCDVQYRRGQLIACKYAEIILNDKPSHNYARPCGKTDRETFNPDTVTCPDNPTGDLRWPDAPCYCNDPTSTAAADMCGTEDKTIVDADNDTGRKGSFGVKSWSYDFKQLDEAGMSPPLAGALVSMSCSAQCVERHACSPSAIFIQDEALTGRYADNPAAVAIARPTCPLYDGSNGDSCPNNDTLGYYNLAQVAQHMVDPLWKRPVTCIEGSPTSDTEAIPPLEENDDCQQGICTGLVAALNAGTATALQLARCLPGAPEPWNDL